MPVQKLQSSPISCTRKSQTTLFRKFNLLYLFVDGNFKPLLACNACVDSSLLTLNWNWILQGENHLGRNARFLVNLSFVAVLWRFDKLQAKERSTPPSMINDVRVCIDPRDLNKELKRPQNPMGSVDEVANRLTGAKSFPWCMQWVLATSIT